MTEGPLNKISRTRMGREVKRSSTVKPAKPVQAPLAAAPQAAASSLADLRATLAQRAEDDAWAAGLLRLLEQREDSLSPAETVMFPAPLRVPFDNRFEQCFEQMLSLIHRQNVQIAELWAIISELL